MNSNPTPLPGSHLHGALLIHKEQGITSFGVVETLQWQLRERLGLKRSQLPSLGHGGTLDPFATGLLVVCVGRGVKLSRYFLGSDKTYTGIMRFGETTVPGDPTAPVSETSPILPESLEQLHSMAAAFSAQPYLQTPPMHSAKKKDGKPLYELARQGIEVEREPKLCHLHQFDFLNWTPPRAEFILKCSSGTYVRSLAQDFARILGTVGMCDTLCRTQSGRFSLDQAMKLPELIEASKAGQEWDELPAWIPFDRMLENFARAEAQPDEARALLQGRQGTLFGILKRLERAPAGGHDDLLAIHSRGRLIAVARFENEHWELERVFGDCIQ